MAHKATNQFKLYDLQKSNYGDKSEIKLTIFQDLRFYLEFAREQPNLISVLYILMIKTSLYAYLNNEKHAFKKWLVNAWIRTKTSIDNQDFPT